MKSEEADLNQFKEHYLPNEEQDRIGLAFPVIKKRKEATV